MKALIDGDILKYQMGWAVQKTVYTDPDTKEEFTGIKALKDYLKESGREYIKEEWEGEERIEPWENCQYLLDTKIDDIKYQTKSDDVVICLSPSVTFRDNLATIRVYKGNRPPNKPHYADKIVQYLMDTWESVLGDNIEADDVMGTMQAEDTCICTVDKDLMMIPGKNYNFNTDKKTKISEEQANKWFFTQLIAGDSTDNIQGIPKMGTIKAERELDFCADGDVKCMAEVARELYHSHYEDGEAALRETAALVWILRAGETPETAGWEKLLGVD